VPPQVPQAWPLPHASRVTAAQRGEKVGADRRDGRALGERDGNRDSNAVAHQADAALGMSSPNIPVRDARPRGDERLITGRNPVWR